MTRDVLERFRPWVVAQMNTTLCARDGASSGVPDMLVTIQSRHTPSVIPLWATEVSFSETAEKAVTKLKRFAARCDHLVALTHIDITESRQYARPKETSKTTELLRNQKQLSFEEWFPDEVAGLGTAGCVKSHGHIWANAMKVTVTTWLRHPNGGFDLDDHDPQLYACAVRCLMCSYYLPPHLTTDL